MPISLAELCAASAMYQVAACEPHPRDTAPTSPFTVVKAEIRPDDRFGMIERKKGDGVRGELLPGDMILHVKTGVVARVVERISPFKCRIEGWVPPQGDAEMAEWDKAPGTGMWICWGRSYKTEAELPLRLRRPEIVLPNPEFKDQLLETHKGLRDKPTMAERGMAPPDLSKLPRHIRRRIMRQWRRLVGKMAEFHDWSDPEKVETELDKHTYFKRKTAEGAEYSKVRLPLDRGE